MLFCGGTYKLKQCRSDIKKIRRKQRFRRIVVVRIIVVVSSVYALFIACFTASAVIGSERTRAPEALKIAFASAGAITVTAGSPTPVGFSPLAMTLRSEEHTSEL